MNKKVVIFGVSTLARLAYVYLTEDSPYEVTAFTVHEDYLKEKKLFELDLVPFERIEEIYPPEHFAMFVAIGYKRVNKARAEIYNLCKRKGYELISYISSKASYCKHLAIGDNCFIMANTVIQPFAEIENDVIIWSGNIGYNSYIREHCYIAPHAVVAGKVNVGQYSFVGANATIREGVTIAPECVIGAGALIVNDTRTGEVYPGQKASVSIHTSSDLKSFQ
ncbi:UDP-3-O-(3-hydroxymyristoyl)-like protein [Candidatus Vecturithrix granuli]|uniref:UDP-3-O-(3-hydroxymyristoyl)-like protein n=1 Tax=Vecturithrix granuli TaxID=1499967 RepID=A0A081BX30_VECG1|nr:UDP-3-O-(3-hydroxymyristoyl)-like protein [Candidatus Vecturithrix granuli]